MLPKRQYIAFCGSKVYKGGLHMKVLKKAGIVICVMALLFAFAGCVDKDNADTLLDNTMDNAGDDMTTDDTTDTLDTTDTTDTTGADTTDTTGADTTDTTGADTTDTTGTDATDTTGTDTTDTTGADTTDTTGADTAGDSTEE
jgi:hypothetical protein